MIIFFVSTSHVQGMAEIKTDIGHARAWIRWAWRMAWMLASVISSFPSKTRNLEPSFCPFHVYDTSVLFFTSKTCFREEGYLQALKATAFKYKSSEVRKWMSLIIKCVWENVESKTKTLYIEWKHFKKVNTDTNYSHPCFSTERGTKIMPSCGQKKKRSSSCIIFFLSLLLTSFVLQMVFKIQVGISFSFLLPNKLRLYVCCQKQNLTNSKSLTDSKSCTVQTKM